MKKKLSGISRSKKYCKNHEGLYRVKYKQMKRISTLFIILLFSSCVEHFEEKEVYGYYTPVGYKNNFDTLQLQPDNVYYRKVYDINKKLLLEMKGKWKMEVNHRIILSPFYMNLDDDLVKFPELVNDTTGGVNTYFEMRNGKVRFCGIDIIQTKIVTRK